MSEALLRERIDYLEAENAQLRKQLAVDVLDEFAVRCRAAFELTATEARILNVLMRRTQVSKASMFEALYGDRLAGPEPKVLDVMVHKLRRKIGARGIHIETIWGVGLRLAPDMRAKVEALLS